jgi:hypothetical protein
MWGLDRGSDPANAGTPLRRRDDRATAPFGLVTSTSQPDARGAAAVRNPLLASMRVRKHRT